MGTITINVDDEVEARFRKTAGEQYSNKKGYLGDAITEAMRKWLSEKEQKEIAERQIKLMEKGLYSLKGWKFNREEIYDR